MSRANTKPAPVNDEHRFAASVLPAYQVARERLAAAIQAKEDLRQRVAEAEARRRRAREVWSEAVEDSNLAAEALKDAKTASIMLSGADWERGSNVTAAKTKLEEAEDRKKVAFGVEQDMEALVRQLEEKFRYRDDDIKRAVNEVVQHHPRIPALVAEAEQAQAKHREMNAITWMLARAFPNGLPGNWEGAAGSGLPVPSDRETAFRDAIGRMHGDPTADLPV